jgi:hypothetical protein
VTTELDLSTASGVWAIRSESSTVYYVDVDTMRLKRVPGEGSSRGPTDDQWCALVNVESAEDTGIIRVGRRHRYTQDPGLLSDYQWWIQRQVTVIDQVDDEVLSGA